MVQPFAILQCLIKAHSIKLATFGPDNKENLTYRWILKWADSLWGGLTRPAKGSASDNINIPNATEKIIKEVPQKIPKFPFSKTSFTIVSLNAIV